MARDFAKQLYASTTWKQVRESVLKRDYYLCQHCANPAEEVHHIIHLSPDNINDVSISLNPDNLISLCRDCHFAEHKGEHASGRAKEDEYPYEFNENGELVMKQ